MKLSLVIACALILLGAGMAVLRHDQTPPKPIVQVLPPEPLPAARPAHRPTTSLSLSATDDNTAVVKAHPRRVAPLGRRAVSTKSITPSRNPSVANDPLNDTADLEPLARDALASVGTDPDADDFWANAINDPDLSPEDRSNLIEDLNETGFPDPNHVTANDLPLIDARLALIEQLAPDAMDDTNAAAFAEAYKDLSRMHDDLQPQAATPADSQLTTR